MLASSRFQEKIALTRLTLEAFEGYAKTHETKKLELGAGASETPGWFCTDLSPSSSNMHYLDVTMNFPLRTKLSILFMQNTL